MFQSKQLYADRRRRNMCPRCGGQMFVNRGMDGGTFDEIVCLQCGHTTYRDIVVSLRGATTPAVERRAA